MGDLGAARAPIGRVWVQRRGAAPLRVHPGVVRRSRLSRRASRCALAQHCFGGFKRNWCKRPRAPGRVWRTIER